MAIALKQPTHIGIVVESRRLSLPYVRFLANRIAGVLYGNMTVIQRLALSLPYPVIECLITIHLIYDTPCLAEVFLPNYLGGANLNA
jgi:hypothetical protein